MVPSIRFRNHEGRDSLELYEISEKKKSRERGKEVGWHRAFLATSTSGHRRSLLSQGPCLKVPSYTPTSLILLPSLLPPLLSTVLLAARFLNVRFVAVKLACPTA